MCTDKHISVWPILLHCSTTNNYMTQQTRTCSLSHDVNTYVLPERVDVDFVNVINQYGGYRHHFSTSGRHQGHGQKGQ